MRRPLFALVMLFSVALSWATPSGAVAGPVEVAKAGERHMEVVQVEGAIDPVVADLVKGSLRRAQTNGASLVILQIDSKGALDTDSVDLVDAVQLSKVPVAAWIGPGKSSARGAAAAVVAAASFAAASPGARLGPVDPPPTRRPAIVGLLARVPRHTPTRRYPGPHPPRRPG
jgi:membrane-bound serine protease (ClpP class)